MLSSVTSQSGDVLHIATTLSLYTIFKWPILLEPVILVIGLTELIVVVLILVPVVPFLSAD